MNEKDPNTQKSEKNDSQENSTDSGDNNNSDDKNGALKPLHPKLEKAHKYFSAGNYVSAKKEIKNILKESPDDKKLAEAAVDLKNRMGIDKGALVIAGIVFCIWLLFFYMGIL